MADWGAGIIRELSPDLHAVFWLCTLQRIPVQAVVQLSVWGLVEDDGVNPD